MDPAWIAFWSGLVGALIGAGASIGTTVLVLRDERKRRAEEWEREERTRFHQERVQFYAEFDAAVSEIFKHHVRVRLGAPSDLVGFGTLVDRMSEAGARVSYVAAPFVSTAASNLVDVLNVDEGQVNDTMYGLFLGVFKRAARDELGVNPAPDPEG